ncbi:MAG: methylated-DNA--[protein]-cysteine S-methyltransferase [Deltaproteobacteria bacterium]
MTISPFAKKVYRVVAKIPLGEVRTYQWVAAKAGRPGASRAVGQILKRNPYPILIPCHRVVPSSGGTGGYRLGKKQKAALLNLEQTIRKSMV